MLESRKIRVLVPYSKTFYFLDGKTQRGFTYDLLQEFEKYINKKIGEKILKIKIVVIPTRRDQLISGLKEGCGDIAAGNLTITPDRSMIVDFSTAIVRNISEIIVSGISIPRIQNLGDLSGKQIYVRESSSYYESLTRVNDRFKREGKPPIDIVLIDELLEDEDLLEMVNAELIPMIVIDSHKGDFWEKIFDNVTFNKNIRVRTGAQIGWALRKNNPGLKQVIDEFLEEHKIGTLIGNILFRRYLRSTRWIRNSINEQELEKFDKTIELLIRYSDRYSFDWLMIAALAYQESHLDQSKRSPAGAVGIMQVLPSTARDPNVNIPDIEESEQNVHAGVKYLRFLTDRYFSSSELDTFNKMLFSFASYNAGPARIRRLREEARATGYDPNVWFRNVEIIAARRIGRETVQYVGNIYKYYVAYRLVTDKLRIKSQTLQKQWSQ